MILIISLSKLMFCETFNALVDISITMLSPATCRRSKLSHFNADSSSVADEYKGFNF